NVRLRNLLAPGTEGGVTRYLGKAGAHVESGGGSIVSIFDAAVQYAAEGVALVILAGKEYGSGSSSDWAAKGPKLLGVRAVIAESYERIHRSNLVGMGILPLEFKPGENRETLGLTGKETFEITGVTALTPRIDIRVAVMDDHGSAKDFTVVARVDTPEEVLYYQNGGILTYVLRKMI